MGNLLNSTIRGWDVGLGENERRGQKRKHGEIGLDETNDLQDSSSNQDKELNTPKRKRVTSTSKYIYQTLFLNGEGSDVTIRALGKQWLLHKVYLSQSSYFASMFSGSWKESNLSMIDVDISDQNVDLNALKIAFGSLYKEDIFIKPVEVVGVLAAATLLQLEGLIQQCASMMIDTLSPNTVCTYLMAAKMYGVTAVRDHCMDWLHFTIMTSTSVTLMQEISAELMSQLVESSELYVMQVEMDIYTMLKRWIFLQCSPCWSGGQKDLSSDVEKFYKQSMQECKKCFLETEEGRDFVQPFRCIRWQHVINDASSLKVLETDQVVPMEWISPVYEYQWRHMLNIEQGQDSGPEIMEDSVFKQHCIRCGRVLTKEGEYCWRWVGYSYSFDFLVTYSNRVITIKRNLHSQSGPQSASLQPKRKIVFRLRIASIDTSGNIRQIKSIGPRFLALGKDEEFTVMNLEQSLQFPLHLSMNVIFTSPILELAIPKLSIPKYPQNIPDRSCHNSSNIAVQTDELGTEEKLSVPSTISYGDLIFSQARREQLVNDEDDAD